MQIRAKTRVKAQNKKNIFKRLFIIYFLKYFQLKSGVEAKPKNKTECLTATTTDLGIGLNGKMVLYLDV
jgi:hypothetical protein